MNEEREKVLEMLADGQITVEQANELLEALSANLVSQQEQRFDRRLDPDKVLSTGFSWVGRWRGTEVALFHRPPTKLYVPVSGHTAFQSFNPMLLVV